MTDATTRAVDCRLAVMDEIRLAYRDGKELHFQGPRCEADCDRHLATMRSPNRSRHVTVVLRTTAGDRFSQEVLLRGDVQHKLQDLLDQALIVKAQDIGATATERWLAWIRAAQLRGRFRHGLPITFVHLETPWGNHEWHGEAAEPDSSSWLQKQVNRRPPHGAVWHVSLTVQAGDHKFPVVRFKILAGWPHVFLRDMLAFHFLVQIHTTLDGLDSERGPSEYVQDLWGSKVVPSRLPSPATSGVKGMKMACPCGQWAEARVAYHHGIPTAVPGAHRPATGRAGSDVTCPIVLQTHDAMFRVLPWKLGDPVVPHCLHDQVGDAMYWFVVRYGKPRPTATDRVGVSE